MELLSVDKPVVELCIPDQELWASVGVELPLEIDDTDSQVYLSIAFCTFLVKCVGKGSLPFAVKFGFPDSSDSPFPMTISAKLGFAFWGPGPTPGDPRAAGRRRHRAVF